MYDIIVVGGGHAGIEAALAGAINNLKVALITLNKKMIGNMPCNPAIGGPAKGIVVREIDALGGIMGIAADNTYLQMKMLNTSKGVAVHSLRAQIDKIAYPKYILKTFEKYTNLNIIENHVKSLVVENKVCKGVVLEDDSILNAKAVILTTGTYMEAMILVGHNCTPSGPDEQKLSKGLSADLQNHGVEIFRLKTGTPPRLAGDSIDYSKMTPQPSNGEYAFSYATSKFIPVDKQKLCYLIHTTKQTHDIINNNLKKSAMYSGMIKGTGPRYCPSIEDKIVRFADKDRHQLFLEPESNDTNSIYLQGFSTSMPIDVQDMMIKSLPGLENCKILKYAYAIEYDAIVPTQLYPTLELKAISNLFSAGQINGTSGYEEAAGQGIVAGINAVRKIKNISPLILGRDESYIGVMIDDLVTKGTEEPYRLLTSRAEYRLLLRHDNADIRLRKYGYESGLVSEIEYNKLVTKLNEIEEIKNKIATITVKCVGTLKEKFIEADYPLFSGSISVYDILKRPAITFADLEIPLTSIYSAEALEQVLIAIKYEGYIHKQLRQAKETVRLNNWWLPSDINYDDISNLALEARQKLNKIKPLTVGQASRISGVNPSDIGVLLIYLKSKRGANSDE